MVHGQGVGRWSSPYTSRPDQRPEQCRLHSKSSKIGLRPPSHSRLGRKLFGVATSRHRRACCLLSCGLSHQRRRGPLPLSPSGAPRGSLCRGLRTLLRFVRWGQPRSQWRSLRTLMHFVRWGQPRSHWSLSRGGCTLHEGPRRRLVATSRRAKLFHFLSFLINNFPVIPPTQPTRKVRSLALAFAAVPVVPGLHTVSYQ